MNKEIQNEIKQKQIIGDRLQRNEDEIEKIGMEKVQIQQDIIENEQIKEKLAKDMENARKRLGDLRKTLDYLIFYDKELNEQVIPLFSKTNRKSHCKTTTKN